MALAKAGRLKPEIRLAQAVSEFEADLAGDQKAAFRADRAQSCKTPPSIQDVMRFTAEMDLQMSRKLGGGRCVGPRMTNLVQAVQQFAALGDVVIGGTQNLLACGVWTLVRMTLLVSLLFCTPWSLKAYVVMPSSLGLYRLTCLGQQRKGVPLVASSLTLAD